MVHEVEFDAGAEEVWEQVVDPGWLGSDGDLDAVPGGCGRVVDDDGAVRVIVVEEAVPGRRLAFRWAGFELEPARVEVDLVPGRSGTRVVVTETPIVACATVGSLVGV